MVAEVPCVDGSELAREIFTSRRWSVQPCVRHFSAVHMTAGHNALRGSGPGQKPAFDRTSYRLITPVGAGIVNRNRAPCDACPVAHSRPPWASMIERQIESPMPMPFDFVV